MLNNSRHILHKGLIVTCCSLITLWASAQYFPGKLYRGEDQMPSNRITNLAQSASGEIWMVTQNGLCSYDGLEWVTFADSLDFIPYLGNVRILATADSSLYVVGSTSKAFAMARYHHGSWEPITLPKELQGLQRSDRFSLSRGRSSSSETFILCDQDKLYLYQDGDWLSYDLEAALSQKIKVYKIKMYQEVLYITTDSGVLVYSEDELRWLFRSRNVVDLQMDNEKGELFVLGLNWLGKYSEAAGLQILIPYQSIGLTGIGVVSNMLINKDRIYFSMNSPLYQYDLKSGEQKAVITSDFGVDYSCMDALFDHEGNLWVASLRGAFKLNNLDIYHLNGNQLLENEVSALFERENGELIAGTNSGFNIISPNGKIEKYPFPESLLQPRVMDILTFGGNIHMAANSAGVVTYDGKTISIDTSMGTKPRVLDLHVFDGNLYASSHDKLYRKNNNEWQLIKQVTVQNGVNIIREIVMNDSLRLLLTTDGVFDLQTNTFIRTDRIDESSVYHHLIHQKEILLGTAAGLRQLHEGKIILSKSYHPGLSEPVYSFLPDQQRNGFWIGTGSGLYLNRDEQMLRLWKGNGLVGNEINRNALITLKNGKMAIGTDQGISFYQPGYQSLTLPIPHVAYTGTSVNGEDVRLSQKLDHDQNHLLFHYKSISYFDEENINYRVRLFGFENEWQDVLYHNQRTARYRNLKPGNYQFGVQARIGNGPWSKVAYGQAFSIAQASYQTWWFKILIAALALTVIVTIAKLRNRHLKSRNELLSRMVTQKTRELNNQNDQLVKTIKDLKAAQGQLIQSEKLASMGHLTAGIAHELNNPLNYIRGGAECILKNIDELESLVNHTGKMSTEDQTEYIAVMEDSKRLAMSILIGANKSTGIVKSLSSFSADSQNFFSFTDLEKEVENALTLLSNQLGFRITINRMFGNIPPIECYPAKISQLVVNLLLNAIQSIEGDGEVTIRIFRKIPEKVSLEITDNGKGIDETNLDKVLEPFFTTKDTNSGLGLTIAEAIVQEHHGQIKLRSTPEKGTSVSVLLPLTQS